jgi:predicted glycosyltransferase
MDYEFQPANHASFRLANRVIVPRVFPSASLRRFGASPRKVVRYDGYKEELYLEDFEPDPRVLDVLGVEPRTVVAVLRPPPEGALYHSAANPRFEQILGAMIGQDNVRVILLPRTKDQVERYRAIDDVIVPDRTLDGPSLLAAADLIVGAGGTMNRESALLGTPTYTIFAGRLSAVDSALIRDGLMVDLRADGGLPPLLKKGAGRTARAPHGAAILEIVVRTVTDLASEREPAAR